MSEHPPQNTTPSPLTRARLVDLLKADAGVSPATLAAILHLFDGHGGGVPHDDDVPISAMAKKLGVPTTTVWRWVRDGRVRGKQHGARLTTVSVAEVEAFVAAHPPKRGRPAKSIDGELRKR